MASSKTPFEIVRSSRPGSGSFDVPEWWNGGREAGASRRWRIVAWLLRPLHVRLNPAMLIAAAIVVFALVGVSYQIGASGGADPVADADERSQQILARIGRQSINTAPLADMPEGATQPNATAPPPGDGSGPSGGGDADPRMQGRNYFCVIAFSQTQRDRAEQIRRFLQSRGVPAMLKPSGRYVQVIALRGFENPRSYEATQFKALLRDLGELWADEHGGRGWGADAYPIRYDGL